MKKVVSLLLVLVLSLGMMSIASAARLELTDGFDGDGFDETFVDLDWDDDYSPQGTYELTADLPVGAFDFTAETVDEVDTQYTGTTGTTAGASNPKPRVGGGVPDNTQLSWNNARDLKLTVRLSIAEGSSTIDGYGIEKDGRYARMYLDFKEPFKSVDDDGVDYDFEYRLYADGDLVGEWDVSGTYGNEVIEVWEDDDYVNIEDGQIAQGQEYNADVDIDLGNGVYVHSKVFKDKEYWGQVSVEADSAFDVVVEEYPDIDRVYIIDYLYINSTAQYVTLNDEDDSFYVYGVDADNNLVYLGRSGDELAFSDRYYLANKELDLVAIEDEPLEDGDLEDIPDLEELIPETGGDDSYPENINDNPGTGR